MSDQTTFPEAATLQGVKKRIVPFEEENPSIEPLFVNFVHGGFLGEDFYLDVGVITLESVDPELNPAKIGDFAVLNRLVMSKRTMIGFRDQINKILEQADATNTNAT